MLQRTNKLLIGEDIDRTAQVVDGASIATVAKYLADGEVVVLDKYFKVLADGATIADSDIIYICQGTSEKYGYVTETGTGNEATNTKFLLSDPIEAKLVKKYTGIAYSAKREQVTTITPETPVAGTEYLVRIVYKDMNEHPGQFTQTYRFIATGTNAQTDLIAPLIKKINAHKGSRVVASGTSTLVLTSKPVPEGTTSVNDIDEFKMVEFDAFINKVAIITGTKDSYWDNAGTVATVAASHGSGNWEQVRDIEKRALPYLGVTNFTMFPVIKPDFRTTKGETYDLIVIEHDKSYISPDNQYVKQAPLTTVIAFETPSTGTQEADVLAKLNSWMASCPGAFENVSL